MQQLANTKNSSLGSDDFTFAEVEWKTIDMQQNGMWERSTWSQKQSYHCEEFNHKYLQGVRM